MTDIYTRNRLINWSVLILVILNLILLATIWYPRLIPMKKKEAAPTKQEKHKRVKSDERFVRFLERELNFTREQVNKFRQLRKEHFQKADQLRHKMDRLRKGMMDHLLEAVPDTTEVEKLAAEMGQNISEHEKLVFNHFLDIMRICDENQKQKYRTLLSEILHQFGPRKKIHPKKDHHPPPHRGRKKENGLKRLPDQEHRPGPMELEKHLRYLRHKLRLTDSQSEKIKTVMKLTLKKLGKIESNPRYKDHEKRREAENQVFQWKDSQIQTLLTDQQKILYQEMKKRK